MLSEDKTINASVFKDFCNLVFSYGEEAEDLSASYFESHGNTSLKELFNLHGNPVISKEPVARVLEQIEQWKAGHEVSLEALQSVNGEFKGDVERSVHLMLELLEGNAAQERDAAIDLLYAPLHAACLADMTIELEQAGLLKDEEFRELVKQAPSGVIAPKLTV